jgi:hypothetical protein
LRVRKLGLDSRPTGRLLDIAATVMGKDGERRYNTMVIRSLPSPDGTLRPFATAGDSGALVVDELDRARRRNIYNFRNLVQIIIIP